MKRHKFFHSSFNSAIFDGPLRIYFSQVFEGQALRVYFSAQKDLKNEFHYLKTKVQSTGGPGLGSVLIFIYPVAESFEEAVGCPVPEENYLLIRENRDLCLVATVDMTEETMIQVLSQIRADILDMEVSHEGVLDRAQSL